jgi:endonuclease/exonuclease/phosphatase family metal-dependent hydrolase
VTALRVATWNVCGLPSSLPPLRTRATEFCRHLDGSDLDVVNLQEVWSPVGFRAIRAGLPSFPHVAWRPAGGLATFSRIPLTGVSFRTYGGIVPPSGGLRFRARLAFNGLLQGVLTARLAGRDTVVANTHLTANHDGTWSATNRHHAFQRAQLERLHAVVRKYRGGAGAAVLTGDFNVASDCPLYPTIVDNGGWRDPFRATDPSTYQAAFLPPGSSTKRIDYLLVAGDAVEVADTAVLFDRPVEPAGYLSDHVGLSARLVWPDTAHG